MVYDRRREAVIEIARGVPAEYARMRGSRARRVHAAPSWIDRRASSRRGAGSALAPASAAAHGWRAGAAVKVDPAAAQITHFSR